MWWIAMAMGLLSSILITLHFRTPWWASMGITFVVMSQVQIWSKVVLNG